MAFKPREEGSRPPLPTPKPAQLPAEKLASAKSPSAPSPAARPTERLVSLDAYRGLTMLLMASNGFGIERLVTRTHPEILSRFGETWYGKAWKWCWETAAYQLHHVEWIGCTAWDLIQPSFMFMVGVAIPYSHAHRTARGDSWGKQLGHAAIRSLVLILLGIFLRSTGRSMTYFTFEDVLTQIGLGYFFVFLLARTPFWAQLVAVLAILGGSWFFFFHHPLPGPEGTPVTRHLVERGVKPAEWNQFTGLGIRGHADLAAHWNKHTNAAAAADRKFLNFFPRSSEYWVNGGGYQTLNFVPSMATMIFGLMAGQLLRGPRSARQKLLWLLVAGGICFVAAMGVDTTIWPLKVKNVAYSLVPIVKRIWTPSWAVFAAGWTFWFLAFFYWLIDMRGFRRLAFPLAIVGMNSIAVYCIAELMEGWLASMLHIHLSTVDHSAHTKLVPLIFGERTVYTPIIHQAAVLLLIWLICLWMYRRKIFVRI